MRETKIFLRDMLWALAAVPIVALLGFVAHVYWWALQIGWALFA